MKIGNKELSIGILVMFGIFFLILFGLTGAKVLYASLLFFLLPFYLILDNFDLSLEEKLIYGFFIGLGIFSTLVYYIAILVGSMRLSIVITFVLLVGISFLLKKFFPVKKKSD